jgi:alpha-L-rhamnosidase
MNSFNHYAYGAIGDWMYRVSAGLETKTPGYRNLLIQPHPSEKLTLSKATYESPYGTVASGWERKDGRILVSVKIPANSKATVILPVDDPAKISENGKPLAGNMNFSGIRKEGVNTFIETGSGEYNFEFSEK